MHKTNFLIIGVGIVGLAIARELKIRFPKQKILVLEKENKVGLHSSGRNSGVLHSGIYYPANSIKTKICAKGAKSMAEYCLEKGLPLNCIGKILIPTNIQEAYQLDLLQKRTTANGVNAKKLDCSDLKSIEPEACSATGDALFVPSTSAGSPAMVINTMVEDVLKLGVDLFYNTKIANITSSRKRLTLSNSDIIEYGLCD